MKKLEQNNSKRSLHINLKTAATKKLIAKNVYVLGWDGLTLYHKAYYHKAISGRGWFFGMRKLSVNQGVWYIGGRKKKRQSGGFFPFAVLAAPILGNFAAPILKGIIGEGRKKI